MGRRRPRRRSRWLAGRPGLTPTARLAIIAAAVSLAKVALFAVGTGTFLAAYRAEDLAWLYLGLALVAGSTSLLLAPYLECARAEVALAWFLAASAGLTLAAGAALWADLPGAPALLLVIGHGYNIGSEILLWLMAASWLPAPELRRATVWIYIATAVGGMVGGIAVERLLALGPLLAALAPTLGALAYAALWLRCSADVGAGRPESVPDTVSEPQAGLAGAWRVLLTHPLGPLLGASSFMLTLVWVMTEFLCLAAYQRRFEASPDALPGFLALVYAVLQLIELLCVVLFTGPVTRRIPPGWRSVLFPLGALLTLLLMRSQQPDSPGNASTAELDRGLVAAVVAHAYTEAASNGLFDPVHASNFAAVPLRFQARIRAVSEGICYPAGMAAGAFALMFGADAESLFLPTAMAAFLFVVVGAYTGVMVTPSLLASLRLTTEIGPAPRRASLRSVSRELRPWARRARLRHRLLQAFAGDRRAAEIRRRIERADRRALAQVFRRARSCDPSEALAQLEVLLDSRNPELRALVAETLLSLPVRRLFLPFLPALRRRYMA